MLECYLEVTFQVTLFQGYEAEAVLISGIFATLSILGFFLTCRNATQPSRTFKGGYPWGAFL